MKSVQFLFSLTLKKCIKEHTIPPELVIYADKTSSTYMSAGRLTMAEKNSQSVPIKGLTGKRNSTLTFMFCLAGEFWRCKLRYQDKTKAGLSRNSIFRKGCCLAQNQTHYSNEGVTLKLTDSIFNPQLVQTRQQLKLPQTLKAIRIWDVFRGQKTEFWGNWLL